MSVQNRAPLRRIDWRFLLPTSLVPFRHLVLLGGNRGIADRIREVGLAQRLSHKLPTDSSTDAVILLADARVDIAAAASRLKPGGLLYWEIDRRQASKLRCTPQYITRRLHAVGLCTTEIYAARPNHTACQFYFPIDAPGSFNWFFDTLYVPQSALQHALESILRPLISLRSRLLPWLLPDLAVIATADSSPMASPAFLNDTPKPQLSREEPLLPFIFTDGGNRLIVLPFRQNGKQPEAVLKIPKLARFNGKNEREQTTLAELHEKLSLPLRRSIPEPLGMFWHGDIAVTVESYVPGQSLLRSSGRWGIPLRQKLEDLALSANWLARFNRETERARPSWGTGQIARWVETPIREYRRRFGATKTEDQLFLQMHQYARRLNGVPFPLVWQHRDFNVWNIFRNGQTLLVIDWEGRCLGPPLCDLLHFVTHWNEIVRRLHSSNARLEAFENLFLTPPANDRIINAVRTAIDAYMTEIELDRRFEPLLLVYTWLELALRRFDQQQDHGEIEANARRGNLHIGYLDVLARRQDQLFRENTVHKV